MGRMLPKASPCNSVDNQNWALWVRVTSSQ